MNKSQRESFSHLLYLIKHLVTKKGVFWGPPPFPPPKSKLHLGNLSTASSHTTGNQSQQLEGLLTCSLLGKAHASPITQPP